MKVKMLSEQQIFDRVGIHLLKQKQKSMDGEQCVYRAPDGLRCAVGVLIADKHYDPAFEGEGVQAISMGDLGEALQKSGIATGHFPLLVELQEVHDAHPPSRWRKLLKALAKRKGLRIGALPR